MIIVVLLLSYVVKRVVYISPVLVVSWRSTNQASALNAARGTRGKMGNSIFESL
jgi:hypothetical protein